MSTSWSSRAQFDNIPGAPGNPPETSTTSPPTFDKSMPITPNLPYLLVAMSRLLLVEIQGLAPLPATWLIGDTSAPGARAVSPAAGFSPSARPRYTTLLPAPASSAATQRPDTSCGCDNTSPRH